MIHRTPLLRTLPFVVASSLGACTTPIASDVDDPDGEPRPTSDASIDGPSNPGGDAGSDPDPDPVADAGATTRDAGTIVPPSPGRGRVIGYYPGWATYERDFQVSELPGDRLTHVNYAFANIAGGRCVLGDPWADVQKTFPGDTWEDSSANRAGNFGALRRLRAAHPSLRTLISVGGWTWSGQFSDLAKTASGRQTFARSCVDFMVEHGFDGIDVDWEYPAGGGLEGNGESPDDVHNYTLLLTAVRQELDARRTSLGRSERYLLTIAAPAGPSLIPHLESAAIAGVLDWINVMTYDFHGAWENVTGHNAPLVQGTGDTKVGWNVRAAIDAYLAAGVPATQLAMGVPFYGRSWVGVSAGSTNGLYRTATGAGPGTWEKGVLDYQDIVARYLGHGGYVAHADASASVPTLFEASSGTFITYDDPASLRAKRAVADTLGLGGVMIWDMSGDDASHSLLDAIRTPSR